MKESLGGGFNTNVLYFVQRHSDFQICLSWFEARLPRRSINHIYSEGIWRGFNLNICDVTAAVDFRSRIWPIGSSSQAF